jgi:hypothetical protein
MISLLLLPIKLAFLLTFGVLFLPFLILRGIIKLAVALFVLPFVALFVFAILAVIATAFALALLVPLIPFAIALFLIFAVVRLASHPRAAAL